MKNFKKFTFIAMVALLAGCNNGSGGLAIEEDDANGSSPSTAQAFADFLANPELGVMGGTFSSLSSGTSDIAVPVVLIADTRSKILASDVYKCWSSTTSQPCTISLESGDGAVKATYLSVERIAATINQTTVEVDGGVTFTSGTAVIYALNIQNALVEGPQRPLTSAVIEVPVSDSNGNSYTINYAITFNPAPTILDASTLGGAGTVAVDVSNETAFKEQAATQKITLLDVEYYDYSNIIKKYDVGTDHPLAVAVNTAGDDKSWFATVGTELINVKTSNPTQTPKFLEMIGRACTQDGKGSVKLDSINNNITNVEMYGEDYVATFGGVDYNMTNVIHKFDVSGANRATNGRVLWLMRPVGAIASQGYVVLQSDCGN